jgi:hypothetical protein
MKKLLILVLCSAFTLGLSSCEEKKSCNHKSFKKQTTKHHFHKPQKHNRRY